MQAKSLSLIALLLPKKLHISALFLDLYLYSFPRPEQKKAPRGYTRREAFWNSDRCFYSSSVRSLMIYLGRCLTSM